MIMKTILKKFREKVKIYLKKLFILTKYFKKSKIGITILVEKY